MHPLVSNCIAALDDPRRDVREAAVETLSRTPLHEAAEALVSALDHPNVDMAPWVTACLLKNSSLLRLLDYGDETIVGRFEALAKSDDERTQGLAAAGLQFAHSETSVAAVELSIHNGHVRVAESQRKANLPALQEVERDLAESQRKVAALEADLLRMAKKM